MTTWGFSRRHRDGIQQTRWEYTTQTYQGTPVTLDYLELMITWPHGVHCLPLEPRRLIARARCKQRGADRGTPPHPPATRS
jgi:hypothetical protein